MKIRNLLCAAIATAVFIRLVAPVSPFVATVLVVGAWAYNLRTLAGRLRPTLGSAGAAPAGHGKMGDNHIRRVPRIADSRG